MEYYNKILCVTYEELTSGDDPVIKPNTLYSNVRRGNIQCVNRGGGEGNRALYVYSSIRDKYQQRFVAKYGEPEEIMRREILRGRVRKDEKAEDSRSTAMTRTASWYRFRSRRSRPIR